MSKQRSMCNSRKLHMTSNFLTITHWPGRQPHNNMYGYTLSTVLGLENDLFM